MHAKNSAEAEEEVEEEKKKKATERYGGDARCPSQRPSDEFLYACKCILRCFYSEFAHLAPLHGRKASGLNFFTRGTSTTSGSSTAKDYDMTSQIKCGNRQKGVRRRNTSNSFFDESTTDES